jgi:hypothetical protein
MFYISSWPEFPGGSEYPVRNLKFSLWQHIWLYWWNVFQPHYGKSDLHQSGWSIYHPYSIFKEILNLNLKIWNSASGSTYGYIVLWPLLGKIQPSPIRMFYTSSSSEFQEGFEYPARNFKFSLWQQIWLYLYNLFQSHSHITGKFDLHQSWWSIYSDATVRFGPVLHEILWTPNRTQGPVQTIFRTLDRTSTNGFARFGSGSQESEPRTKTKKTEFTKKTT